MDEATLLLVLLPAVVGGVLGAAAAAFGYRRPLLIGLVVLGFGVAFAVAGLFFEAAVTNAAVLFAIVFFGLPAGAFLAGAVSGVVAEALWRRSANGGNRRA